MCKRTTPKKLRTSKLGYRSDLLDGLLRFNATWFSGEWTGIQVAETVEDLDCIIAGGTPASCPNLPNLLTFNAGAADVSGLEIELVYRPTGNLLLDGSFGFLDTEYTDTGTSQDIQIGDTFQQAPDLTYSVGAQYDADLANGGSALFRLDYAYTDSYVRSRERQRQTGQDAFGLVNARVAYSPPAENWRLALFGTSLTDEGVPEFRFPVDGYDTGSRDDRAGPREIGVSFEFFFD